MTDARLVEVEVLLSEGGCPVCRFAAQADDRFFSWFAIESHTSPETIEQLRAALGMCPAHTRRLLGGGIEPAILTSVYREVAKTAAARVEAAAPAGVCPACASARFNIEFALTGVLRALDDTLLARRYVDGGGLCVPHLVGAVATAEPSVLGFLCETLSARLDHGAEIAMLAGLDRDALSRASWRARLPDPATAGSERRDTMQALLDRLATDVCPACLLGGQAERRYLSWLVAEQLEHGQILATDPGDVCPAHLADLAEVNADTAAAVTGRSAARWRAELTAVSAELALAASGPHNRGHTDSRRRVEADQSRRLRWWAAPGPLPTRADWATVRNGLARDRLCPICRAVAVAQRRELALLVAGLKLPAVGHAYRRGHGLCAGHLPELTETESASFMRQHLAARLGVLAWELEESARKEAWACRHEPKGPEASAHLRLIAQIDGRALMGAPALAHASRSSLETEAAS